MISKKYHFITGLPRSGSTLIAAILNQNPNFHSGMTSSVGSLTHALRTVMSKDIEVSTRINDDQRRALLKGVFDSYYSNISPEVIFDTNRGWAARIAELGAIFTDVKLIAMVRNPAWIVDSFERVMRENPLRQSGIAKPGTNIKTRSHSMMQHDGIVGSALGNLLEALSGPDQRKILMIEYDALCLNPKETMKSVYKFLDEPYFEHDFDKVEYEQDEFDYALQTPGLHTVSGSVEMKRRNTLLPFEIFQSLSRQSFWGDGFATQAAQIIIERQS